MQIDPAPYCRAPSEHQRSEHRQRKQHHRRTFDVAAAQRKREFDSQPGGCGDQPADEEHAPRHPMDLRPVATDRWDELQRPQQHEDRARQDVDRRQPGLMHIDHEDRVVDRLTRGQGLPGDRESHDPRKDHDPAVQP